MLADTNYLIIGAGIVGLTLAKELLDRGADRITIIEKEPSLGLHASGRNSGVLHAGIYYPPNTLKAQLCLQGNLLLQAYCEQKNLPLQRVGKVVVAKNESEVAAIHSLHDRAKQNGADVTILDEQQLADIEPHAKTHQKALYSLNTAIVDNKAILKSLYDDLVCSQKVTLLFNTLLQSVKDEFSVNTSKGVIRYQQLINTAGAYADKVSRLFGVGNDYFLIPFKGIYKKLAKDKAHLVNGNIYPVPNLGNPFLGVHFTRNISGDVYVGPTAIPAFGRENYGMIKGIDGDAFTILLQQASLFVSNSEFRKVALEEPKKYISHFFFNDAKQLVKELHPNWLLPTAKVGIRPQLIHLKERKLMMDFLVQKEKHTLHILNAISPAFTSSMAFAKYIVNHYLGN